MKDLTSTRTSTPPAVRARAISLQVAPSTAGCDGAAHHHEQPQQQLQPHDDSVESPPWVVKAWQQRGLIPRDKLARSREDLANLHSESWFVRRNRKSPHACAALEDPESFNENAGWLARRNRNSKVRPQRAPSRAATAQDLLQSWMKSKFPRDVQPRRAEPATSVISPCASLDIEHQQRQQQQQQLLLGSTSASKIDGDGGPKPTVYLTLYDLCTCCNGAAHQLGVGVYHSGIVVEGIEYTYDNVIDSTTGSGVVGHAPYYTDARRQKSLPLRGQFALGTARVSARASHKLLRGLSSLWHSHDYDIAEHNCHHWCHEAAAALGVQAPPPWVNRATEFLRFFSGLPAERQAGAALTRVSSQRGGGGRKHASPMNGGACGSGGARTRRPEQQQQLQARRETSTDDDLDDDDIEEQRDSVRAPLLARSGR